MSGKRRSPLYRQLWRTLVEQFGCMCFYCDGFATTIDHVIPAAAGGGDDLDNCVLACAFCNFAAGSRVFDDVWQKRQYILNNRKRQRKMTQAICSDCLLPYEYRVASPSIILCAECYDIEYGTELAQSPEWRRWLVTLSLAEYDTNAHRRAREVITRLKNITLADKYRIVTDFMCGDGL